MNILWDNISTLLIIVLLAWTIWEMKQYGERKIDAIKDQLEIDKEDRRLRRLTRTRPISAIIKIVNFVVDVIIWSFSFLLGCK